MANIRDIVLELIKDNDEMYSIVGKVKEVDKAKRLCRIEPNNGDAELFDVRLQSVVSSEIGLVLFPALDSDVTVTFLSKELAFVSQTSEIEEVKLDIGDFSLFIDAENFDKSVKNITINTTNYEKNATDTKINSNNYEMTGENAKFTISTIFEVISSGVISAEAQAIILEATNIDLTGVTTINGMTTINGVTQINGAATIAGAATMSGAVSMGGGTNGGIPKGAALITELNKIITEVNKIRTALVGWTPVNNDGGAALKARVGGLSVLSSAVVGNISNENAVH